jgi:hypothetical protein
MYFGKNKTFSISKFFNKFVLFFKRKKKNDYPKLYVEDEEYANDAPEPITEEPIAEEAAPDYN